MIVKNKKIQSHPKLTDSHIKKCALNEIVEKDMPLSQQVTRFQYEELSILVFPVNFWNIWKYSVIKLFEGSTKKSENKNFC